MGHRQLLLMLTVLLLSGLRSEAATYTVKAGGGGNYTTISACAAAAVAGDTCMVYAGTYAGWTQSTSGIAGNPITFEANGTTFPTCPLTTCSGPNGDTVNVTSAVDVSGIQYIQIIGFHLSATTGVNTSTNHITMSYNNVTATLANQPDSVGSADADNIFSYNVIDRTGIITNSTGFYFYGDRNRFEHNEIKNGEGDCFDLGGSNLVIRDNYCHDANGASGEHIDFIQEIGGGTSPPISFSLVEGNVNQHCYNDGGNCHGIAIIRTGSGPVADTIIFRFNLAQNIDGDCINFGGSGDDVPNNSAYNNTCASEHLATYNTSFDSTQGITTNTTVFNNIAYDVETGGYAPFSSTSPGFENGNLAYTVGYTGSWNAPYSSEATYAALANQNPQFVNYPSDLSLKSGSPALGAGVAGTATSGSGSNSTSLVVGNSHLFQPGWAGINGDCIRVGALVGSPTTCITAINYSTNTLTVSPPISWSTGDPVYLYKRSDGTVVLTGANPDVGATQIAGPLPPAPNPPGGLIAIVH